MVKNHLVHLVWLRNIFNLYEIEITLKDKITQVCFCIVKVVHGYVLKASRLFSSSYRPIVLIVPFLCYKNCACKTSKQYEFSLII